MDSLYVSTLEFLPRHMDGIAAFQGLKVLHLDRQTMKAETMDSAAFSRIGELTELEELLLAMQLTEVDGEGFMMGLGPLHQLRRLECFGVERVSQQFSLLMQSSVATLTANRVISDSISPHDRHSTPWQTQILAMKACVQQLLATSSLGLLTRDTCQYWVGITSV